MSKPNPTDRLYSKDHEWILDRGDGTALVGITDYAQEMLTDIVLSLIHISEPTRPY